VNPHDTEQCGFTNPPLGLLYLAGTLLTHGFDVKIVDGCRDGENAVYEALRSFCPDLVGITCLTPGRNQVIELVNMAKAIDPFVTVVLGGVHPTIMYKQMMEQCPGVDFIVLGEGEGALLEIVQGKKPAKIDGIVFRESGGHSQNWQQGAGGRSRRDPVPCWHLVDLHRYQARGDFVFRGIDLRVEPRISIIFSRGCKGTL